jgi:phosphatidate cytidylyltransferase
MLRWRLILGAFSIAAMVGLCWLDVHAPRAGSVLLPLAALVSIAAVHELLALLFQWREKSSQPSAWAIYGGVLVTVLLAGAPVVVPATWLDGPIGRLGWLAIGLAAGLLLAFIDELRRFESPGLAIINLALASLAILYVGGLVGFLVQLRLVDDRFGMFALVSLIATVKMSDTGQYFVGRQFGKTKLATRISPGKTWEGLAGGVLAAIIAAWIAFAWAGPPVGFGAIVLYALALAAAGVIGDLAESLLKRDAGVKDSSTWLPGFGGVLDMLDSLLIAAPVAYVFWANWS